MSTLRHCRGCGSMVDAESLEPGSFDEEMYHFVSEPRWKHDGTPEGYLDYDEYLCGPVDHPEEEED